MVGGTIFHRRVIQREISRVLVLNLSGKTSGAKTPPTRSLPLTQPSLLSRATRPMLLRTLSLLLARYGWATKQFTPCTRAGRL